PFESFFEKGMPKEVQKLRYQDYEQQRQDLIIKARKQRHRLIAKNWTPRATQAVSPSGFKTPTSAMGSPSNVVSASPAVSGVVEASRAEDGAVGLWSPGSNPGLAGSPTSAAGSEMTANPTAEQILENEKKRMEKALKRQNKEIETMMAHE